MARFDRSFQTPIWLRRSLARRAAVTGMVVLAAIAAPAAPGGGIARRAPGAEKAPDPSPARVTPALSAPSQTPPVPPPLTRPSASQRALAALSKVGENGPNPAENESAAQALRELVAAEPGELPRLFAALDHATPVGANWIRAAIDTIANRCLADGALPADEFETFFADRSHSPRARRLAYEWLVRIDPAAVQRLAPTLLDDPSVELRRDAVARVLSRAADLARKEETDAAVAAYRQSLDAARDEDQVRLAVDALGTLGHPVDIGSHYGFIREWRVIGPFDNADKRGFGVAYPPERGVDLGTECEGKFGPVRWQRTTTTAPLGEVDLNQLVVKQKGVLAYALAELDSPGPRKAEVRVGCENAIKIWLNGRLVFEREVYHANVQMDQYIAPIELQAGRNLLLLKVCQNEQTDSWAGDWKFQARISDFSGGAIALQPPPKGDRPPNQGEK